MIKTGSRLPSEYQEVEYIEATGTQYIDINYIPQSLTKIKTKASAKSTNGHTAIFGSRTNDYTKPYLIFAELSYSGDSHTIRIDALSRAGNTGKYWVEDEPFEVEIDAKNRFIKVNNEQVYSGGSYSSSNEVSFSIFALHTGYIYQYPIIGKVYYLKVWEDDVLVRDLVPCYKKSNNEIGLYDLANNVFYTNIGSGTFGKGKNALATIKTIKLHKDNNVNEILYAKIRSNNLLNINSINFNLPYTIKGITYSRISEGIIHAEGEKTEEGYATWGFSHTRVILKAGKTYATANHLTASCYKLSDGSWYGNRSGVFTPEQDIYFTNSYITTAANNPNFDTYLTIVEGDIIPVYYVPYMAKVFDQLPNEYQRVEYIETDGNQYIDTNYIPNYNTRIIAEFAHNESTIDTPFFGVRKQGSLNQFTLWSHPSEYSSGQSATQAIFNGTYTSFQNYPTGTRIKLDYSNSKVIYGQQTNNINASTGTPDLNLILFGLTTGTVIDRRKFSGKLWKFKIYDNNILVRDMIPCYRKSDNEIGLYDLSNNVFYTNLGTGSFTKGNNI